MNRAEYEVVMTRVAAVEARCELLEAEVKRLQQPDLDAQVAAEQARVIKKAERRAGSF